MSSISDSCFIEETSLYFKNVIICLILYIYFWKYSYILFYSFFILLHPDQSLPSLHSLDPLQPDPCLHFSSEKSRSSANQPNMAYQNTIRISKHIHIKDGWGF